MNIETQISTLVVDDNTSVLNSISMLLRDYGYLVTACNSAEDALRMRQHTGCAGIMIGRGSFGNPWLFRDARALLDGLPHPAAPSAEERFAVALRHARLAIELQGDTRHTVVEFRKHFGWYTRGLHGATRLRQRLFQVETMSEAQRVFEEYLAGAEVAAVS